MKMPKPGEHKTVQSRILKYAKAIGWKFVPRAEAEQRRGFDASALSPQEKSRHASQFFDGLLYEKVRRFNPLYTEAQGSLVGQFRRFQAGIYGNRDFLGFLRNTGKFFHAAENRERDLTLIDYEAPGRNIYEITEEFYWHYGHCGIREDVV